VRSKKHIHVATADGTAKIWIEPIISLADYYNISSKELNLLMEIVKEKQNEIIEAWNRHFSQQCYRYIKIRFLGIV
jgi:hypothetical protein